MNRTMGKFITIRMQKNNAGKREQNSECTDRELNPGYWLGRPKSYH